MKNMGTCTALKSGSFKDIDASSIDPIYQAYVQETGDTSLEPLVGCRRAIHTEERYIHSIKKCDKARLPFPEDDPLWHFAGEYTRRMFDYQHDNNFSLIYDINMSTSVGKPYSSMGFKTKSELLADPNFPEEVARCHTPIWSVFSKDEYLPLEDIDNFKLRTIFNPELPFLIHQKFFFDEQNHRMKKYAHSYRTHWPRYGFIKQYGGFHRLCTAHELAFEDPLHYMEDVSGYDRDVGLRPVYDDRRFFLFPEKDIPGSKSAELWERFKYTYEFVEYNTLYPTCVTNDGTMFQRPDGNSSGSNNTTVDNCWSHTRIKFYVFLRMGMEIFNRILTYAEIMANVVISLYGDDILGTINRAFWFVNGFNATRFETIIRETYALLNLTIKEKAFKFSNSLEGLEFLGSTCQWNHSWQAWVPRPRLEKLTTSITQVMKVKNPDIIAASLTTFADLVALGQTKEELVVQLFLKNYSRWLLTNYRNVLTNETDVKKLMDIRDGRLNSKFIVLGLEGKQPSEVFDIELESRSARNQVSFFPGNPYIHRKEVGFKNNMLFDNTKKKKKHPGAFQDPEAKYHNKPGNPYQQQQQQKQQQQQQQQQTKPVKAKATWLLTESDFAPPGFESMPETLAYAQGIPGGPNFLSRNYIGFINEYKVCAHAKGLPLIDDIAYDYKMTGQAHMPGWECKATCVFSGNRFKTMARHLVKKDAQQACARLISLYVLHNAGRKNKLSMETVVSRQDFCDFWQCMRTRFSGLTMYASVNSHGFQPHIADEYLLSDGNDLFEDIVDHKFQIFRVEDSSPPPRKGGWKRDLSKDGDVEENPGPITYSRESVPIFSREEWLQYFHQMVVEEYAEHLLQKHHDYLEPDQDLTRDGDVEPNPGPLTKAQYLQKHKTKYDKAGLNKTQRDQRYAQYQKAQGRGPARKKPNRAPKARNNQRGDNSVFNSMAAKVSRDQISGTMRTLPRGPSVHMSDCARLYAVGLVNPFTFFDYTSARLNAPMGFGDMPQSLPCVPTFPSLKTRRAKYFLRGATALDLNGAAFFAFAPRRLANDYNVLQNNLSPLIMNNATTIPAGQAFPVLDTGAALPIGYTGINGNSDFSSTELSSPTDLIRLVCSGVRIRYAGADMTRSGIIHCCLTPSHTSLSGQSLTTLSNYETYFRLPVSKKWFTLVYTPVLPGEYQYDTDIAQSGFGEDNIMGEANTHYMGIYVTGGPPSALIEYEACFVTEVVGPNVRDLRLADSDVRGLEMVSNVVRPEMQQAINMDGVGRVLSNVIRSAGMLTTIGAGAMKVASNYTLGAARSTLPLLMG